MFYGLFCSKFFTDHFYEVHFGPSGPTYAKKYQKLPKIRQKSLWLDLNFLETWTEIEKTLRSKFPALFVDSKTPFGLILSLMGFSKKCTLCISVFRHQCAWAWIKFFFAKFFRRIFGRRIR